MFSVEGGHNQQDWDCRPRRPHAADLAQENPAVGRGQEDACKTKPAQAHWVLDRSPHTPSSPPLAPPSEQSLAAAPRSTASHAG
jgi:hypothetical protein